MVQAGYSLTTVSIYIRHLRTLFNDAIDCGMARKEQYPFGRRRYQVPASVKIKKALQLSDVQKIFSYKAKKGSKEQWAKDMWVFSYLCNGINVRDIARLKYKNIDGNSIQHPR